MGPHFYEEHRAARYYSQLSKKLEEMRVTLEKGDKPEVKELVRQLQKLVPGIVIIEDETQQEHWLLSDNKNTLSANRQAILDQLLDLADKGDWVSGVTSENVKTMLKTVLGLGESPLTGQEAEMSETLWNLLESGRGERLRVTWQNLIGYFDDWHLLKQKSAPALNMDFFGDKDGSDNINKGRPSRDNMSSGFREVLPLLDAYVPKLDKKAKK